MAGGGVPGGSTGTYLLDARLTPSAPLLPDLTGSSFRTGADMAASGDAVPVSFTVENRGGADPGNFRGQLVLGGNNLFDSTALVLATLLRSDLTAGANDRSFSSPPGLRVTLPAGLTSSPLFLGLRIVSDPSAPEAGSYDKSGVHRGSDWETLTVVARAPAGATDLSRVDPGLRAEINGMLSVSGPDREDAYAFTLSDALGGGELTAEVASVNGGILLRLTLSGP